MLEYRERPRASLKSGDLARIEECLADGWPLSEIYATYGYTQQVICKHFPGRGMDLKEAASLGWLVRKFNQGSLKGKVEHEAKSKNQVLA